MPGSGYPGWGGQRGPVCLNRDGPASIPPLRLSQPSPPSVFRPGALRTQPGTDECGRERALRKGPDRGLFLLPPPAGQDLGRREGRW